MRNIFALSICLAAVLFACASHAQEPKQPNIVIIYADEWRDDCLGAAGNTEIQTPNVDALAADGVLYRNSYCVWPVCTPSRLSLLSGMYVRQHGGRSNRSTLPPDVPTFAQVLRDKGYSTAAVGKMHFMPAYQDVGFQRMILAEQNGDGRFVDDYHRYLKERGIINALDIIDQEQPYRSYAHKEYRQTFGARVSDVPDEHHITTWVGDRAIEEINGWDPATPNVLMAGFLKPHHPFDPPAPWHERYDADSLTPLPGWTDSVPEADYQRGKGYFDNATLKEESLRRVMAYYYATITHMDHHIGRIVDTLKEKGLYDDTLIIVTADHGEYMGYHHMLLKGNYMYEPVVKVPLIIKYPKQRYAGVSHDALVNTLDVTATILAETDNAPWAELRGEALGQGRPGHAEARKYTFVQNARSVMIRSDRYKMIRTYEGKRQFLFDLQKDPTELVNLVGNPEYTEVERSLEKALLDWYDNETHREYYLNLDAPVISGDNIPKDMKAAQREMEKYIDKNVKAYLESTR